MLCGGEYGEDGNPKDFEKEKSNSIVASAGLCVNWEGERMVCASRTGFFSLSIINNIRSSHGVHDPRVTIAKN